MTDNQIDLYINDKVVIIARSLCSKQDQLYRIIIGWVSVFELEGKKVNIKWQFEDEIRTYTLKGYTAYETSRVSVFIAA